MLGDAITTIVWLFLYDILCLHFSHTLITHVYGKAASSRFYDIYDTYDRTENLHLLHTTQKFQIWNLANNLHTPKKQIHEKHDKISTYGGGVIAQDVKFGALRGNRAASRHAISCCFIGSSRTARGLPPAYPTCGPLAHCGVLRPA